MDLDPLLVRGSSKSNGGGMKVAGVQDYKFITFAAEHIHPN
jgi:hypothetical protein